MNLSIELKMLLASSILGIAQLFFATHFSVLARGLKWDLSPRDQSMPELTGVAGRIERSFKNFLETFSFFVVAIFLVHATSAHNQITSLGAQLYFWSRLLYVPAYAAGIPGVRSVIWIFSIIGIGMLLSVFFVT